MTLLSLKSKITEMVSTVREINRRYSQPALATGKGVKFALLILRFYLLLLVGLLIFKFFLSLKH